jgi:hypothetical protein
MQKLKFIENASPPEVQGADLLTSRLSKSKNFWKTDRSLDFYLEGTKALNGSEKRL